MDRVIPARNTVYYPVRIMFEEEKRFVDGWQEVTNGAQTRFCDDALVTIEPPQNHGTIPLRGGVGYWLPGIETDPDPADTQAKRDAEDAAEAAARAATIAAAEAAANAAASPPGGSGQDSVPGA